MADLFRCFADLATTQVENIDYRISYTRRRSELLIMAPHGSGIEPLTAPLARLIAGEEYSIYCFEGIKKGGGNRCLHITSTNFDEPIARAAAGEHRWVIAVHGARETASWIMIGGRAQALRSIVQETIQRSGFEVRPCDGHRGAVEPANICNAGMEAGVQLELSAGLRNELKLAPTLKQQVVTAVRSALAEARTNGA